MQRIDLCKRLLTMALESKSVAPDSIAINHRASLNRYRQPWSAAAGKWAGKPRSAEIVTEE